MQAKELPRQVLLVEMCYSQVVTKSNYINQQKKRK